MSIKASAKTTPVTAAPAAALKPTGPAAGRLPTEVTAPVNLIDATDADLVALTLRGRADAFEELVRRHKTMVMAFLYARLGNRDQAEDIAQESFMKAFQNLDKLENAQSFSKWLMSIAYRLIIDLKRKRSGGVSLDAAGEQDSSGRLVLPDLKQRAIPEDVAGREIANRVFTAIDALPGEYRETLAMRYGANMSCEQIAKALSITVGTVTSRLCRGNRMLRTTLQGLMDETGQHKVQAPPSAPSGRDTDAQ
ncbi:MAG TPA: sigma-70 family RNA polymerase sigma factor [Planctomycetota bacterium]|nr:sigma-70 family RNA polymerase sigma factor [Planctomycetota bacterium]